MVGRAHRLQEKCGKLRMVAMGNMGMLSNLLLSVWRLTLSKPSHASPHHVVMIADPQLVDPHTYPGRPWPLSSLTVRYTDRYLRRSYSLLQKQLHPDTLFFLGDLFDGGREWATDKSSSPEERYRKYGDTFWMREYKRFRSIFIDHYNDGSSHPDDPAAPSRRIIASLPGNHDLGFGSGIQEPVKKRFEAYFGNGNRIDIIGNHTFVSVDTVSLSALDQADPVTGSSGSAEGSSTSEMMRKLWKPVQDFLLDVKSAKQRLVTQEVLRMTESNGLAYHQEDSNGLLSSEIVSLDAAKPMIHNSPPISIPPVSSFPNILLTHVPLYRQPGADCGPLRERGHSIPINAGYQYQNVLTPTISEIIMDLIDAPQTAHIYSGDDHDYCDYTHTKFTGMIKETTVKSISWAMGIRKPGFLSLSLWNPVDLAGTSDQSTAKPEDTIQQNLCLLPDQLQIFIRYGQLLILTLILVLVQTYDRTIRIPHLEAQNDTLLPLSDPTPKQNGYLSEYTNQSKSSSTSAPVNNIQTSLSARNSNPSKSRTSPPSSTTNLGGYGNLPPSSRSASPSKEHHHTSTFPIPSLLSKDTAAGDFDEWGMPTSRRRRRIGRLGFVLEFRDDVWSIAWPVVCWYLWVIWHGCFF